ncbi:hypothetical protein BCR34DRAFT_607707 [Clohesyomyces aquaticus]|uniref:Uncharacterized protein n=1 Tax=Clohesyomyces aquaticus TaxID=1231657 RepID=A0A1Y1YE05_9PLEO|nr:hypothetical protein BCR34DRAFT_607707 [Clohesyomyces aquaticus]
MVTGVFRIAKLEDARDLWDYVLDRGNRPFLILVMTTDASSEKISLLRSLKEDGFDDTTLPIDLTLYPDIRKKWLRTDKDLFDIENWRFTAPIFGRPTKFRFKFPLQQVLPFLHVEPRPTSSGFFSEISRTIIHAEHLDSNIRNTLSVFQYPLEGGEPTIASAIKNARDIDKVTMFLDQEAYNLKLLRSYKSPHLIKPIAAYQINQDRCLVLP